MIYAIPYILLVIFYGVLAICYHQADDERRRFHIKIGCIAMFIFFFGFRGFIFYDWTNYYQHFRALPDFATLFTMKKWEWETGFTLLAVGCKTIIPDFQFFVFVCCVINTFLITRFFTRYTNNLPLAFVMFLSFNGIVLSTDLMRNSLSILLFINSIEYLQKRKPIPFFAINLLGFMFHSTALVFMTMYFFLHRKYNKWILLAIFVIANAIYLMHIPLLKTMIGIIADMIMPSTKYWLDQYTKMDTSTGFGLSIGYLERLITFFLMFCYIDKLRNRRPEANIFINSVFLYLILFLMLSEFRTVSTRVSGLFCYGYWIVWIDFIKCFTLRNNRLLFLTFMAIYCVLKTYTGCNYALADYENTIFGANSFSERYIFFRQHFNENKE